MNKIIEQRSLERPTDHLSVSTCFELFVIKNFFDAELCKKIRAEVRSSSNWQLGEVYTEEGEFAVDETARKTQQIQVSKSTESLVERRLMALKPKLENHFHLALSACEGVNFLLYREGSFYTLHQDNITTDRNTPDLLKQRQVSIIIFLNEEAEELQPDSYSGGALVFYGLLKDPRRAEWGFPIKSETGLLIAFPSDLFHEVEPVTYGKRFSIVSWFWQ